LTAPAAIGARDASAGSRDTIDAFLGGRVEAVQPASGHHRAGLEAVLLAASLDAGASGTVVDLGAGVGVAGFCAAERCAAARIVLVERDPVLVACAREGLVRPANAGFGRRVTVIEADISAREPIRVAIGLGRGLADAAIMNPPFHESALGTPSPEAARADAHVLGEGGLVAWLRAAASLLKPGGAVTVIFRADGLDLLLAAFGRRFGGLDILASHPRAGLAAHRVLARGVKGSRAGLRLLPPLILHGESGNAFRPEIDRVLRDGAGLADIHRPWRSREGSPC
jgi:tRNA1(Val) A37 N6-methylase TrmN6